MKNITTRQYRLLCDQMVIFPFMTEIYERDWRNGVAAPFLEYALASEWMDKSYAHRNRIWMDGDKIVAFCFNESPITDTYFSLRPGYEELAPEMMAYADEFMPKKDGKRKFVLFKGQSALMEAAAKLGYEKSPDEWEELLYDFSKPLDYKLPEGFRFTPIGKVDPEKVSLCCWKGFDHEETEGPWNGNYEGCISCATTPHATPEYALAIENEAGEYVCFSGMWWVPGNHLAYMEPLCTVPEYRKRGLAAAILSEHYRRMKPLGATHMTGGGNQFYAKIGYGPGITWTSWVKPE